jgi:hypothetical protein
MRPKHPRMALICALAALAGAPVYSEEPAKGTPSSTERLDAGQHCNRGTTTATARGSQKGAAIWLSPGGCEGHSGILQGSAH